MKELHNKYKNWKSVPVPEIMKHLPKDTRGYPIPENVMWIDGKPVFAANNGQKELHYALSYRCSTSGTKMTEKTVRLISAPLNGLGNSIVVLDAPIHVEALHYSMKVCPYMCLGNYYRGFDMAKADKFNEKFGDQGLQFINTSPVNAIPPFMMEIHPRKITPIRQKEHEVFYTVRHENLIDFNFWRYGEIMNPEDAIDLLEPYCKDPEIQQRLEVANFTFEDIKRRIEELLKLKKFKEGW